MISTLGRLQEGQRVAATPPASCHPSCRSRSPPLALAVSVSRTHNTQHTHKASDKLHTNIPSTPPDPHTASTLIMTTVCAARVVRVVAMAGSRARPTAKATGVATSGAYLPVVDMSGFFFLPSSSVYNDCLGFFLFFFSSETDKDGVERTVAQTSESALGRVARASGERLYL